MAERSLRGTNLSTLSLETDEGIAFSERQMVSYKCAQGHVIELPFSVEADVPALWAVSYTHLTLPTILRV